MKRRMSGIPSQVWTTTTNISTYNSCFVQDDYCSLLLHANIDYELLTGVPWHIIVYSVPFKDSQGIWRVLNQVHITVLEGNESQDSATNIAITKASLMIFAKANPQIKSVLFRSDNAG